jgi:hypothetical protein
MSFRNILLFISKLKDKTLMNIGKISKNEKILKFNASIHCTDCGKQVPGGLKTGEAYYQTKEFEIELENFMKKYLCGICRDKKRLKKN